VGKKTIAVVLVGLLSLCVSGITAAHSGRTNSSGCHNDRKHGGYHCHNAPVSTRKAAPIQAQKKTEKKSSPSLNTSSLTDADITDILIKRSIRSYSGSCACPYNSARNGSRCGKRSAWSKQGGYSPLCYASDVSHADIKEYRDNM
jgi:hypothetical protein